MTVLAGRRVVVTRASEQADALADVLTAAGATPVVVPLIEIVADAAGAAALTALQPADFQWLVVTSPNGADHYLRAHPTVVPPMVAVVGTATAAVLAAAGRTVSLVPAQQRATGLLAEFPAGRGPLLLVQAVDAEPTLAAGLADLGWQVTVNCPYRSEPATPTTEQRQAVSSADAVLFASGSAARAWVAVFGVVSPPLVVAIGPQTAAATEQAGLKVALVAADHSLVGMVEALERHLASIK